MPGIDCLEEGSDVEEVVEEVVETFDGGTIEDDATILPPCPTVVEETTTPPFEETTTQIEVSPPANAPPTEKDYHEAFQVVCGVIVVFAVLYIIAARIDDWRKYRR